jgi:hypothetical protein
MRWDGIGAFGLQMAAFLWITASPRPDREPAFYWIIPILLIALSVGIAISGLRKGGFANWIIGPLALLVAIWHAIALVVFWHRY